MWHRNPCSRNQEPLLQKRSSKLVRSQVPGGPPCPEDPSPSLGPGREGVALGTGWGVFWGWRGGETGKVSAEAQTDRNLTARECAPGTSGWLYHQVPEQRRRWQLESSDQPEKSAAILGARPHHPLPRGPRDSGR